MKTRILMLLVAVPVSVMLYAGDPAGKNAPAADQALQTKKQQASVAGPTRPDARTLEILKRISTARPAAALQKKVPESATPQALAAQRHARQHAPRALLLGRKTEFLEAPPRAWNARPEWAEGASGLRTRPEGIAGDTLVVGQQETFSFSFAPGSISALLRVYLDTDNDGIIGSGDILIGSDILLMDNDLTDMDPATGTYTLALGSNGLGLTSIVGNFILSVNNFQSVTNTQISVRQKSAPSVLRITISPPLAGLVAEVEISNATVAFFTDTTGIVDAFIDRTGIQQATVYVFDPFGKAPGYIAPPYRQVVPTGDTTVAAFTFSSATAFITGYCRDQSGAPVAGVPIRASGPSTYYMQASSDTAGNYTLGVEPGSWYLYVGSPSSAYMTSYNSRYVLVYPNGTSSANFTFQKCTSSISGNVSCSGSGVGGVLVNCGRDSLYNTVLTQGNGTYSLPVTSPLTGQYFYDVSLSLGNGGYYVADPAWAYVPDGSTGVNFTIVKVAGGIRGTVTNSVNGLPVEGAFLYFSGPTYASTATDDSGHYHVPLRDGSYQIYASAPMYASLTIGYISVAGAYVTYNFSMIPAGAIAGTVRSATGIPIRDALVSAYDVMHGNSGYAYSDTAGRYFLGNLPGGSFTVGASAVGYLAQYYNMKPDLAQATPVFVQAGDTTENINFALSPGGSIAGVVLNKTGAPIAGASVTAYDTTFAYSSWALCDSTGHYTVSGLKTGDYYIYANAPLYTSLWYQNAQTLQSAKRVHAVENETTGSIDFTLVKGCDISGTVRDDQNKPLAYVWVYVVDSLGFGYWGSQTDTAGHYLITGLSAGPCRVGTSGVWPYGEQWYDHKPSMGLADVLRLAPEESRTGIDFDLFRPGIYGAVVDDTTGVGIPNALITVTANDVDYYTGISDYSGAYSIQVPAGSYAVRIELDQGDYGCRYYYTPTGPVMFEKDASKLAIDPAVPGKEVNFRPRTIRREAACVESRLAVTLTNRGVFSCSYDTTKPSGRWPTMQSKNYLYESDQWVGGVYIVAPWAYGGMYNAGSRWRPATDLVVENVKQHQKITSYLYSTDLFRSGLGAGILMRQEVEAWPQTDYILCRRTIFYDANMSPYLNDFSSMYGGLFADFDVSPSGAKDLVGIDTANHLIYAYDGTKGDSTYLGLCLFGASAGHYVWWTANYDTSYRTPEQKYGLLATDTMSALPVQPADCRIMVSDGPFPFNRGDSIRVSMAMVAGRGLAGVVQAAQAAFAKYIELTTGVKQAGTPAVPVAYALHQNYPNPFNPSTTIAFDLPRQTRTVLKVFNVLGQEVSTLVDEVRPAGSYRVQWPGSGSSVASGVYFYTLSTDIYTQTRKMLLLK